MPMRTHIGRDGQLEITERTTSATGRWTPGRVGRVQERFREAVLTRDDFTCQRCGRRDPSGATLEAHHVRAGYDVGDGITLCGRGAPENCHRAVDRHAR